MKFKIDENLPAEATEILQAAGFDALSVVDQFLIVDERRIRIRG